jgi:serpin B
MKQENVFLMLCVMMMFCACQSVDDNLPAEGEEEAPELILIPREDVVLTSGEQTVAAGNNAFAFELLRRVSGEEPDDNLMVSPLSLSLALAMLNNGAAGATQEEIQQALGGSDLTREDMNGYFRKMVAAIQKLDATVTFESANAIWAHEAIPIRDAFKETNRTYFDAEARNFSAADDIIAQINDWCNEKTHGMIPWILQEGDRGDVYLANALYFKGYWTAPFDKSLTRDAVFTGHNGAKAQVPMMKFETPLGLSYLKSETFEAVELPYGNEAFGMTLLLPAEGVPVASIVEGLNATAWNDCLSKMYLRNVNVCLPRFKAEYTRYLNDDLIALGITSMFESEKADFAQLSPISLSVSFVKQKTTIEVKESGTEAAAVTVTGMVSSAGGEPEVIPLLEFNRPFIYFIKEKSTGSILFSGIVRNL